MPGILPQIKHVVVVMLENRSFDNLCGWLYSGDAQPSLYLPRGSRASFEGLAAEFFNPSNTDFFDGNPPVPVYVTRGVGNSTVLSPDPQETFANVTQQLYGPKGDVTATEYVMQGFVVNYATADGVTSPGQIMQAHLPTELPVLSQLAQSFAISDAWFASVPSQTWPNRAFVHAGTSNGHVDNGSAPNPLQWNVPTIFNVLSQVGAEWGVYSDTVITPSLTRTMFPALWEDRFSANFHGFEEFEDACTANTLPAYAFIEPSFLIEPDDAHPPHDIEAAEQFLFRIWNAVGGSKGWNDTLLVITFDEHGGCYDHVLPPTGAQPPDPAKPPGDEGFQFDRFGVRVPSIVVSPYVRAGTVFRSDTAAPYDHTSILATLRDWLSIPADVMLPSGRIKAAPTLAQVLSLSEPRTDLPTLVPRNISTSQISSAAAPNDLQKSLVAGTARRLNMDATQALAGVKTRQQVVDYFKRRPEMGRR
jgi:phospholipase C